MRFRVFGLALLTAAAGSAVRAQTTAPTLELSTGVDYSIGRYGGTADTTVIDVPLTAKLQKGRLRLEGSVPFVFLKGPGELVDGVPVSGGAGAPTASRSGLGDINLTAVYLLTPQTGGLPGIEGGVSMKLPTAGPGLGTERTDYAVVANLYETLSPRIMLFSTLGYSWLGDPADYALKNGLSATAGINFKPTPDRNLGVSLAYRQPLAEGLASQLAISPYVTQRFAKDWGLTLYAIAGLTDASPRFGAGLWLSLFR